MPDRLLEELVGVAARSDRVYAHEWRPGDLLMWTTAGPCTGHTLTRVRAAPARHAYGATARFSGRRVAGGRRPSRLSA